MRIDHPRSQEEAILMEVREPVRRFLRRLVYDPELAEDARSETLLTVIQRMRAGLKIRRPISFALQVAWTKAQEVRRRASGIHPEQLRSKPQAPRDPARIAELKDWLESGLAELKPIDRAVIHLRYSEDLSYREIARVLGEPEGTIGRRLHEARNALRASLEKSGGERVLESTLGALLPLLRPLDAVAGASRAGSIAEGARTAARTASRITTPHRVMLACALVVVVAGTWIVLRPASDSRPDPAVRDENPAAPAPSRGGAAPERGAREAPPLTPAPPITGRVVDESGRGVAGATVFWHPADRAVAAWDPDFAARPGKDRVAAGAAGVFELHVPPPHALARLVATAPGFAPTLRDGVRAGAADVVLRLTPGLTIGGTIRDLGGSPVEGATIAYHASIGATPVRVTARSGRDGRYLIEMLPVDASLTRPDAGAVVVDAPRHAPQVKPVGMAVPGARQGAHELDVWLARGSSLEGTVRDRESGLPVAGAVVEVWTNAALEAASRPGYAVPRPDPLDAQRIRSARTDSSGRYRLDHMPVRIAGIEPGGRFMAGIRPDRLVLAGGLVASAPGRAPTGAIVPLATEDDAVLTVDVLMDAEVVLAGGVRDARGAPVPGAEVRVHVDDQKSEHWQTAPGRIRGQPVLASAICDAGGNWVVGGLGPLAPSARFVITASAQGHETSSLSVAEAAGRTLAPDLVLRDAIPIEGIVVDENGGAVAGAAVTIEGSRPAEPWGVTAAPSAATDRAGRFRLESGGGPEAGVLRVTADGFSRARAPVPGGSAGRDVRVTMPRERVLRGTLRSSEGKPVAGGLVTAFLPSADGASESPERDRSLVFSETASDETGAFVLGGLPSGRVGLWAGVPWPRNDGLLGMLLGRKFAVVVQEPADQDRPLVVTLPYTVERGDLVVRVVDADAGKPILHDLKGSLVAADGMIGGFGLCSGPGLLVFHAVPSGTYGLVVEARVHPRATTSDVRVGVPGATPEIAVRLRRGARVTGRVTWEGELPAGAIHLVGKPDDPGVGAVNRQCSPDGTFDLDGLAPGKWRFFAELEEAGRPPVMTTRPRDVVLEVGVPAPPVELRLLAIQDVLVRLSKAFAEGEAPTMDKGSPKYGDVIRKIEEFRVRCRDAQDFVWFDATVNELAFGIEDRDLIVRLPLPEGSYTVAIDHGDDELGSLRMRSPGRGELLVPGR
jgi:RNA polymerase sigma-70 factor (ECF subfamily)